MEQAAEEDISLEKTAAKEAEEMTRVSLPVSVDTTSVIRAYLGNAHDLRTQNNLMEARDSYHKALEIIGKLDKEALSEETAEAWFGLAEIALSEGNVAEARANYQRAAILMSDDHEYQPELLVGLGRTYVEEDIDQACLYLEEAKAKLEVTQDEGLLTQVNQTLAEIYERSGTWNLAIACYAELLKQVPDPSTYYRALARNYSRKGDLEVGTLYQQ
jgi:tetratricopeptide (TPR) repeat protein